MSKIWIVDDDAEMLGAVRLMLKVIGCETEAFSDAPAAARALLAGRMPDLMMLDINMPQVSGLDLLEFVRRRAGPKQIPVLMLSTEASDVTVDRAMSLGANGYLTKPITLEELQRALDTALQPGRKGAF